LWRNKQLRTDKLTDGQNLPVPAEENELTNTGMQPTAEDRVTIAPGVLLTMIRMGAVRTSGVVRMGNTPGGVNAWLRRTPSERGVQVLIEDNTVTIDVYIVADADSNLREVSQNVQRQVARDIEENVGMRVGAVNIHIEDVVFDSPAI
jgi:uncharacterized alkaline shock family protein YloU